MEDITTNSNHDLSKHLFIQRSYTTDFIDAILKKIDPLDKLYVDESGSPFISEIHHFHAESNLFPERISISDWTIQTMLPEINEIYGQNGWLFELDDVVTNEVYDIEFFFIVKYNDNVRSYISSLSKEDLHLLFEEYRHYNEAMKGIWFHQANLLLIYQMIALNGIHSLLPFIPQDDYTLRKKEFKSAVLSMTYIWILYFWECHNKTFKQIPDYLWDYCYLPCSPQRIISNYFHDITFDVLLTEGDVIEAVQLLNTCPGMSKFSNWVLQNILTS